MKKYQKICLTIIFLFSFVSVGFCAADKSVKEALKESIYNTYGIKIFDYVETNGNTWSEYYLKQRFCFLYKNGLYGPWSGTIRNKI